ncbi:MAG: hypothetical protein J6V90_08090 [Treponema sp.]|nr:hypothetical protein [Treponema sp.]
MAVKFNLLPTKDGSCQVERKDGRKKGTVLKSLHDLTELELPELERLRDFLWEHIRTFSTYGNSLKDKKMRQATLVIYNNVREFRFAVNLVIMFKEKEAEQDTVVVNGITYKRKTIWVEA